MPKHDLLVLKDAAVTKACSWWDSEGERSSPSVASAGSSEASKPFHVTKQLDCSCSWINEVTTVQTEFVAKCFMRNHSPSMFDLASRCSVIYPLVHEVCEGPRAFGKCTSVNPSVPVQTTAAVAPRSLWNAIMAEETLSWTVSKATHCFGRAHFQPAPVTSQKLHDVLWTLTHLPPSPICRTQAIQFHFLTSYYCR